MTSFLSYLTADEAKADTCLVIFFKIESVFCSRIYIYKHEHEPKKSSMIKNIDLERGRIYRNSQPIP